MLGVSSASSPRFSGLKVNILKGNPAQNKPDTIYFTLTDSKDSFLRAGDVRVGFGKEAYLFCSEKVARLSSALTYSPEQAKQEFLPTLVNLFNTLSPSEEAQNSSRWAEIATKALQCLFFGSDSPSDQPLDQLAVEKIRQLDLPRLLDCLSPKEIQEVPKTPVKTLETWVETAIAPFSTGLPTPGLEARH
jgi:hypothetical protein